MQFPAKVKQGKFEVVLEKDCLTIWYDGIIVCDIPESRIKDDPRVAIVGYRMLFEMIEASVIKDKGPMEFINQRKAVAE